MKKILYIIAAGAMLLAGCSKESDTPATDSSAVKFSTEIATRASGTTWDNGDAIGIFMVNNGDVTIAENATNKKHTTTGGSSFTAVTGDEIYYPVDETKKVDFIAYYPFLTGQALGSYNVDVTTQTTPAAIDLLYSNNAVNKAKSTTAVALEFDHMLSRMVLNIKAGEGMTAGELTGVTVKITGMPTKADFKLADGTFGTPSTVSDITPIVATTTSGFVATYTAIVVPQAVSAWSDRKMVFTVGMDVYEHPIPDADDFTTGKNYPYAITVSKTGVSVTRGTITDWTGTIPEDIVAEQIPIPQTVKIPAGSFIMGSSDGSGDNGMNPSPAEPNRGTGETQHEVTLTKDFYMSKYQITNAQYAAFLNAESIGSDGKWVTGPNPGEQLILASSGNYDWGLHYNMDKWEPVSGFESHPVIYISWYGSVAYCAWLSEQTGGSWRLPTEAQWEYACRGGKANHPFGIGTGTKLTGDMANFNGRYIYNNGHQDLGSGNGIYLAQTQLVGSYTANNYGLYDMHGNVLEWCSDWYGTYDTTKDTDPTGPNTGNTRVLRGGSWNDVAQFCRSAVRDLNIPDRRSSYVGFRVVFVPIVQIIKS